MSLKTITELIKSISNLEDDLEVVEIEVNNTIQAAYIAALREHTNFTESEILNKWLNYNAANDNLRV
jgi:hypothetical protein